MCPYARVNGLLTTVVELVGGLAVSIGAFAVGQGSNLTCVYIYVAAALRFSIDQAPGSHLNRDSIGHARVRDRFAVSCLAALVLGGTGPLSLDLLFAKLKSKTATASTAQSVSGEALRSR